MVSVLFVCLGNICRSPMAEAVFMHKVRQAGLENAINADSAGTGDWHVGKSPHFGTLAILASEQIDYEHAARMVAPSDFDEFDIICTMDEQNYKDVSTLQALRKNSPTAVIRRFMEFAPQVRYKDVPDPYYNGNFSQTFDLVSAAADGLLDYIRAEYKL